MPIEPLDPDRGPAFPEMPTSRFGLRRQHSQDILITLRFVFWFGIPLLLMLIAYETRLLGQGRISTAAYWVLLALNFPITAGAVWLVVGTIFGSAAGIVGMMSGMGGTPVGTPGFSREEALVMQDRIAEAVGAYRQRIADEPANVEAKLRLAALLAGKGNDMMAARSLYLDLRLDPSARAHEATIAAALLQIYQSSRDMRGLRAELAREARLFPTTARGQGAQRLLRDLPRDDTTPGPGVNQLPPA